MKDKKQEQGPNFGFWCCIALTILLAGQSTYVFYTNSSDTAETVQPVFTKSEEHRFLARLELREMYHEYTQETDDEVRKELESRALRVVASFDRTNLDLDLRTWINEIEEKEKVAQAKNEMSGIVDLIGVNTYLYVLDDTTGKLYFYSVNSGYYDIPESIQHKKTFTVLKPLSPQYAVYPESGPQYNDLVGG